MRGLGGLRILIVEDEFLLADDLARHFRAVGAEVIGPAPTISSACRLLPRVEAAILDVNLAGNLVFPLADALQDLAIPFVFFTGYEDIDIPSRFRYASRLPKPSNWRQIASALIGQQQSEPEDDALSRNIMAILPKLRLAARLMLHDPSAADRLVERTLELAIREGRRPEDLSVPQWLNGFMRKLVEQDGADLLQ